MHSVQIFFNGQPPPPSPPFPLQLAMCDTGADGRLQVVGSSAYFFVLNGVGADPCENDV